MFHKYCEKWVPLIGKISYSIRIESVRKNAKKQIILHKKRIPAESGFNR